MPTVTAPATYFPRFNIAPRIIQNSDPLEQRLRLAQIANLESQPDFENRRLAVEENRATESSRQFNLAQTLDAARLGEATRHNVADETDSQQRNQIARDTLTKQLQVAHDANQQRMAEAVMTHLPNLTAGLPQSEAISIASKTLGKLGYPELSSSLDEVHKTNTEKKVATALAQINALQGKPDELQSYLPTLKADPDVWSAVKDSIPANVPTDVPAAKSNSSIPGQLFGEWNWYRNKLGLPAYNAGAGIFGATPATPRTPEIPPLGHILKYYFGNKDTTTPQ